MKNILYLLLIFLAACSSNKEDIYNVKEKFIEVFDSKYYSNIDAITPEMKEPLLIEDFTNNSKGWQTGNSNGVTATIANGYFYMKNATSSDTYFSSIVLNALLQSDNYQIEISFKTNTINNNISPKFNGLAIGFDEINFKYNLFAENLSIPKNIDLSANGKNYFSVQSNKINNYWTQYNNYVIRKIGGKMSLFINNNYTDTYFVQPTFFANRIGFAFNQILQVDYLYVNKLNI